MDARSREATLDRLDREGFDLAVIGGGISGAGIARHAALRGLSVALLDSRDFASGTSSRSSKLLHGGLRYLAQGDVALVRKVARERSAVHRIAPHLAEPRWMLMPVRSRASLLKFRAAVATYEKLGAVATDDRHRSWDASELADEEPQLDTATFPHALAYREYLTDDAWLVLANLRAAHGDGAALLNHAPVEALRIESGRAAGLLARCRLSGREVRVRARAVVNAGGPWLDPLRALEAPVSAPLLHLSKGVHVVLPAERLPVRHLVVMNTTDRRSIFAIRREDCVYVGTTDTTHAAGHEHWPRIEREDVGYLLEPTRRYFPRSDVAPRDVVAAWAGLRPLIAQPGKAPTEISRRDEILLGPAGVVHVAGGKLTGYRLIARDAVDTAAREAGIALREEGEEPPLPGGDFAGGLEALARSLTAERGLDPTCALRLARHHGGEAAAVVGTGALPLLAGAPVLAGEVSRAVTHEAAATLEDAIYRRLRTAWMAPGAREALLERVAARMAELLDWSPEHTERELERVRHRLAAELAFLAE